MSEMINKTAPEGNVPLYLFRSGKNSHSYEYMGVHNTVKDGKACTVCRVWAPNAQAVAITGDFCEWDPEKYPLTKIDDAVWEGYTDEPLKEFDAYKLVITAEDGTVTYKADPYAFHAETRPGTASRYYDISGYKWNDGRWFEHKKKYPHYNQPVNIYEMHLGSWRRHKDGTFLTYTEIAEQLVPYLKEMGYTHVEFMPVMEHPLDMSWGYQVSGYYAARFGEPKELMALIDALHQAGIGVLLDWVPAHFPRDAMGLRRFDGTPCYEHPDPRRGDMPQWGTHMFDYARGEVNSFMLSNACFWLEWYHADGLRVDAVTSMLMYDFCREPGQWLPNKYGGHENLDAIAFLRRMNETVYRDFPGVMMVAEESSAYPMVTRPIYLGGLGFGFKWNMGWMNDMLAYIKLDPVYRKYHHDKLTFSLMYAFSENYILPFSHDEVVHGKHSMLDKQPGDLWKKFAGLRALYGYTMAHPGKKLLFMGGEFGHFIEWKYDDQLDWFLLLYENHPQVQQCCKRLNEIYRTTPALYQIDDSWDGFQWIQANDSDNSIVAFLRTDKRGNSLLCVTNFTPVFHPQYRIGLPQMGTLTECFNTDRKEYGGSNQYNNWAIRTEEEQLQDFQYSCDICVPPLSTVYFTYQRDPLPEKAKKARVIPEIADVPPKKASQTAKKPQPLPEKSAGKANSISIG